LAIDQVIVDRVKSTSAAELEVAIEGIVKMNASDRQFSGLWVLWWGCATVPAAALANNL